MPLLPFGCFYCIYFFILFLFSFCFLPEIPIILCPFYFLFLYCFWKMRACRHLSLLSLYKFEWVLIPLSHWFLFLGSCGLTLSIGSLALAFLFVGSFYVHCDSVSSTNILLDYFGLHLSVDDIFTRLLKLTADISHQFICFIEDLASQDVDEYINNLVSSSPGPCSRSSGRNTEGCSPSSTYCFEDSSSLIHGRQLDDGEDLHVNTRYEIRQSSCSHGGVYLIIQGCCYQCVVFNLLGVWHWPPGDVHSTVSEACKFKFVVYKTLNGSSDDIGWLQCTPGMAPVDNGTPRFIKLLTKIRYLLFGIFLLAQMLCHVLATVTCIAQAKLPLLPLPKFGSEEPEDVEEGCQLPVVIPLSAVMAVCALHLQLRYREKSDGLVTCRDSEVPGSVAVRPDEKLDHAWMVYSSCKKDPREPESGEMCEALLAMLVELDKSKQERNVCE